MRFLSKKRIDQKRDSTRSHRLEKAGETALAVTAGAVFLRTSKFGRNLEDYTEALIPAAKRISKDFKTSRGNLGVLKKSLEDNIGSNGSVLRKAIENNKELIKRKEFKINTRQGLGKTLKQVTQATDSTDIYSTIMRKEIDPQVMQEIEVGLRKFLPDDFKNGHLNQIVQNVYYNVGKDIEIDEKNKEMFKLITRKTFRGLGIDEENQKKLVEEIAKYKKVRRKELYNEKKKAMSDLIRKDIKDKALSYDTLSQNNSTRFQKAENFLNKYFGIKADLEYLITGSRTVKVKDLERLDKNGNKLIDSLLYEKSLVNALDDKGKKSNISTFDLKKALKEEILDRYNKGETNLGELVLDKSLKYRYIDGEREYFITRNTDDFFGRLKKSLKGTLPGNILFKGIDDFEQAPVTFIERGQRAGTAHLQKITQNIKNEFFDNKNKNIMVNIGGKTYDIVKNETTGTYSLSDQYIEQKMVKGYKKRVMQSLLGKDDRYVPEAYQTLLAKFLDLNQEGSFNLFNDFNRRIKKFNDPDWGLNVLESTRQILLDSGFSSDNIDSITDPDIQQRIVSQLRYSFNKMNENVQGVSDDMIESILDKGDIYLKDHQKELLKLIQDGDINEFFNTLEQNKGKIKNEKLLNYLERYKNNSDAVLNTYQNNNLDRNRFLSSFIGDYTLDDRISLNIEGQLRTEIVKDIFQDMDNEKDLLNNNVYNFIDSLENLSEIETKSFKNIGTLSLFEKDLRLDKISDYSSEIESIFTENSLGRFIDRLNNNANLRDELNLNLENLKRNFSIFNDAYASDLNEKQYKDFADNMFVNKSSVGNMALDLISKINSNIKSNGQVSVKDIAKEFLAGRNDPEHISGLTIHTQYMLDRLSYSLEGVGLGLSSQSTSNALETVKNIALKRILPTMAIVSAGSVLNYESEKITGVSLKGAAANSVKNLDMAGRRLLDATGLSRVLNWGAEASVIHDYWFGQRHFNNYEEEQDWYDNGYSPVRAGRYWSFGSSSEFRGGNINYFQPNYLKRAHSNYHDVSIYGSIDEKWAHSWIPTIQHPLAPVRRLLDPYWLEKKHLKENDRPYPLTGKMFSEGTPWGAVLNPTVGQILKPVRMLPQAKHRLGKDGRDSQAIIERLNTRIKQRGNRKDDLLMVRGTDIRNAEYVPYGNPEPDEINVSVSNGSPKVQGRDYINSLSDIKKYETPDGSSYYVNSYGKSSQYAQEVNTGIDDYYSRTPENLQDPGMKRVMGIVKGINNLILNKGKNNSGPQRNQEFLNNAPDKKNDGIYVTRNLVNERLRFDEDYYTDMDTKQMVDKSLMNDFIKDASYSAQQISGIYGYLKQQAFGENAYTYRYENAGQMTSFTRGFWDSSIGGIGGEVMEIARRFFPNQDRSRVNINPLRNNMPDWIPSTYHTGDPYTQIPKGEMRLPGKGYETLNALHPDQFGEYGAFDRYKILADIAPNSTEYKTWKAIAENTVSDPKLKEQMEDIEVRTSKMSGKHEFFEYKYIKNNTKYEKAVVKSIANDGTITLGNNQQIKLAGLKTNEYTQSSLQNMLNPGDKITVRTYKNLIYDKDNNSSTKEAVIYKGKENINEQLINTQAAEEDKTDNSPLAILGRQTAGQEVYGAVVEAIGHMNIPLVHNKLLKIETPLESYKNEQIYGSSFQTWEHPIKNFITPAFNRQSDKSIANEALSLGYAIYHFTNVSNKIEPGLRHFASSAVLSTLNPTAFVGGNVAMFLTGLKNVNVSENRSNFSTAWQTGAKIGTALGVAKYGWDNADNPIKSTAAFAVAGAALSENLKTLGGKLENTTRGKGALIGAAVGFGLSAIKNPSFDKDKMFKPHVSNYVKKKWELDEYFDRLTYIKYMGLYKVASARAALFEHTPIRDIFKDIDKNKKKIAKIERKQKKLADKQRGDLTKNQFEIEKLEQKRLALQENSNMFFTGKKYTKAAVAYKKKAESTIYGLSETATTDEILAAVPEQYKDYFNAFMKVSDRKEQKQILKYVPEYLQRPLQIAWGEKPNEVESNKKYFKDHYLPGATWRGWKPSINLKHVKIKTIENEGMIMSDFGYYDSEKSKASYEMAPEIEHYDRRHKGGLAMEKLNMTMALNGAGLSATNITVEPTSNPGLWIVGDITGTASDIKKAASYEAYRAVQGVMSTIF